MECSQVLNILTLIVSLVGLIIAVYIPVRIMQYQQYTNLSPVYMNSEFGHAFQSVIDFFHDDCNCDVERIPEEYIKRYNSDFEKLKNGKIQKESVLHYQRRLLSVYFCDLDNCRSSNRKLRKIIKKDWTTSESYVLKIIICMNDVVKKQFMKDISSIKHQYIPRVKGISEYLDRLSTELSDGKPWMQL